MSKRVRGRSLSLVLVLAMVLSLCAVGFAWDTDVKTYTDQDQVSEYAEEALATLTGMGIIEGTGPAFEPQSDFTREQAAKIVAYMILGKADADVLPNGTTFSDVENDRWSNKYIEFAASRKIVAGYGDGNFGPEDVLTREAWLKILLVTLGYDPEEYGLVNDPNWAGNALSLALKIGLITDKEAKYPFNRETAVLYAFNTETYANTYHYVVTDKDGDVVYDGYDKTAALANAAANPGSKTKTVGDMYGEDEYGLTQVEGTDLFGRSYTEWNNGKAGPAYQQYSYEEDAAVASVTYAMDQREAATILGKAGYVAELWVDGEEVDAANWIDRTANGTLTEFYKLKGDAYKVVMVNTYVKQLTKENIVAPDMRTGAPALVKIGDVQIATDQFEIGDVVIYQISKQIKADPNHDKYDNLGCNMQKVEPVEQTSSSLGNDKTKGYYAVIDSSNTYIVMEH